MPTTADMKHGNLPNLDCEFVVDEVDLFLHKQDGKIERDRDPKMCKHNRLAKCLFCLPIDPYDEAYLSSRDIKHMSFHSFIRKLTDAPHGRSTPTLFPLENIACHIEPSCSNHNHRPWPKALCTKCLPDPIVLTRQRYRHVDNIVFESQSVLNRYLDYLRQTRHQRIGILLGRYTDDADVPLGIKCVVSAIYEPPQVSTENSITLLNPLTTTPVDQLKPDSEEWQEFSQLQNLCRPLGLRPVGWIVTDLLADPKQSGAVLHTRHADSYFVSAEECITAACFQCKFPNWCTYTQEGYFGSKFVTVVVSGSANGEVCISGYQVSNQCEALVRENLLVPTHDAPELAWVRESSPQQHARKVVFVEKDPYGNDILKNTCPVPVEYFLVEVPCDVSSEQQCSFLDDPKIEPFVVENRTGLGQLQNCDAALAYITQFTTNQIFEMLNDFHFLYYLATNNCFRFTLDELKPIFDFITRKEHPTKAVEWSQTSENWKSFVHLVTAHGDLFPLEPLSLEDQLVEEFSFSAEKIYHQRICVSSKIDLVMSIISGFHSRGKDNDIGSVAILALENMRLGIYQSKAEPFKSVSIPQQNFASLRQNALTNRELFIDPTFPANIVSVYPRLDVGTRQIDWMRPWNLVNRPRLFSEMQKLYDINQGELANCWLLAGLMCLTLNDALFYRVVPPDQTFAEPYLGIFRFNIWQYGNWVEVVIDDLLPTEKGELIFTHSQSKAEFWSALLEKVFAKVFGSYEALAFGAPCDAMVDLTGGIGETIIFSKGPKDLWMIMANGCKYGALMAAAIDKPPIGGVHLLDNGLIREHSYAVLKVKEVGGYKLIKCRNPWGIGTVWNQNWSAGSNLWDRIPEEEKSTMTASAQSGEFWIDFDDFAANFHQLDLCYLGPDVMESIHEMTGINLSVPWRKIEQFGSWSSAQAGGCKDYDSFGDNPQYLLTVPVLDSTSSDDPYFCIVSLVQKENRSGLENRLLHIGYYIFEIRTEAADKELKFSNDVLAPMEPLVSPEFFLDCRQCTLRIFLLPGNYILIPCTKTPKQEREFLIRIFTKSEMSLRCL